MDDWEATGENGTNGRKKVKGAKPMSSDPALLSPEKRKWWSELWPTHPPKQPRMAVLFYAMSVVMRPTTRDETILYGYVTLQKFHDREPEAVLKVIEGLDSGFFDTYPRKSGTKLTKAYKKAVIGEAAQCFFRYGIPAYGKPNLRGPKPKPKPKAVPKPLAVI